MMNLMEMVCLLFESIMKKAYRKAFIFLCEKLAFIMWEYSIYLFVMCESITCPTFVQWEARTIYFATKTSKGTWPVLWEPKTLQVVIKISKYLSLYCVRICNLYFCSMRSHNLSLCSNKCWMSFMFCEGPELIITFEIFLRRVLPNFPHWVFSSYLI